MVIHEIKDVPKTGVVEDGGHSDKSKYILTPLRVIPDPAQKIARLIILYQIFWIFLLDAVVNFLHIDILILFNSIAST